MSTAPPKTVHQPWPGLIAAYRDRLPVEDGWTPITLREGVYAGLVGPAYETPAEVRMLRILGADLAGDENCHKSKGEAEVTRCR